MKIELERVAPMEIEARSFEIIESELPHPIDPALAPIIKRVIHTTADFEYADSLCFSENVVEKALAKHGGEARCFIGDADVAEAAKANGTTRAVASMEKAATIDRPLIFAIGNAPTALVRIRELMGEGRLNPRLVIGVPVGFVNVVQSKELIMTADVPFIVARGRKGGSNVAAAICNALLYMLGR